MSNHNEIGELVRLGNSVEVEPPPSVEDVTCLAHAKSKRVVVQTALIIAVVSAAAVGVGVNFRDSDPPLGTDDSNVVATPTSTLELTCPTDKRIAMTLDEGAAQLGWPTIDEAVAHELAARQAQGTLVTDGEDAKDAHLYILRDDGTASAEIHFHHESDRGWFPADNLSCAGNPG